MCRENPSLRETWGCESKTLLSGPYIPIDCDDDGKEVVLLSCPIRYIPMTVFEFLSDYDYRKKYPGSVTTKKSDTDYLFLSVESYFERWHSFYSREVMKNGR